MRPLLKWAGGKRSLLSEITRLFPSDHRERRYHEPFFGGGAVFFHLKPRGGTINDVNRRLMNFYRVVRDRPSELIAEASRYRYEEEEYYQRRTQFNSEVLSMVQEAALVLYLNKTAYNGLYRVNSKGEFNVPFGRHNNPTIVDDESIFEASEVLRKVEIRSEDFNYVLPKAEEGDLCYLDPPYQPAGKTANFTDYIPGGFTMEDQRRLRDLCIRLDGKGVNFVLSNSDTEDVRQLFSGIDGFNIIQLRTKRMISSRVSSRGSGWDLLITNRP